MSTLTGHLSLYATQSLKAIDDWMNVAQSNIGGSLRTAYKETELMYGGNLTHEIRPVSSSKNGVQIAEQVLTTGNTRVNWRQGEIISSTQETHFAINGDGFFAVQQMTNPSLLPNSAGGIFGTYSGVAPTTPGAGPVYLTRAGDFHWGKLPGDSNPNRLFLLTNEGFVVLSDHGDSNNALGPVTLQDYNTDQATNGTFFHVMPSVVQPTYDTPAATPPAATVDYDELKYSKYGSNYFEFPTAVSLKVIVEGAADRLDRWRVTDSQGDTILMQNALEASNVRVERNITELASMGKIYNGFVQLIKVYNSNLDEVLGFIR